MPHFPSIAILGGTGDQGYGLALRWARAGERILIGSRVKQRAEEAAAKLRVALGVTPGGETRIEGCENPQAAERAEVVVLSVPFPAQIATLKSIRDALQPGKLLIDLTVPLEATVGGSPSKMIGVWAGSAAEQAAANVPEGVEVVAAFHNVGAEALQDLTHSIDCDVLVCSNNSKSRAAVRPLVELIPGCRYVDGGRLENARIVESLTALLIGINRRYKVPHAGIRITGLP